MIGGHPGAVLDEAGRDAQGGGCWSRRPRHRPRSSTPPAAAQPPLPTRLGGPLIPD